MKRLALALLAAAAVGLTGCTAANPEPRTSTASTGNIAGPLQVTAQALVHHNIATIDTITVEYPNAVVLPEQDPAGLFTISDESAPEASRIVSSVATTTDPDGTGGTGQAAGRFVVIRLAAVTDPPRQDPEGQTPNAAGAAVLRSGWSYAFRSDYSDLIVAQEFDARTADGRLVASAGSLPTLQRDDVTWPDFADFTIDDVLDTPAGAVHYSYSLPPDYDPTRRYPLVVTLPGYGGLLLSDDAATRGVNVFTDRSALAWTTAGEDVVVLAPQLDSDAPAEKTIALTEHFLDTYSVDRDRVYAAGYSAGGETLSRILNTRADLFAAYVHVSSRWNGAVDDVVAHRLPVYIFMAENDEYYGVDQAQDTFDTLTAAYEAVGLTEQQIAQLVVLRTPADSYFSRQGITYFHDGGMVFADDPAIVQWVLNQQQQG